jgi:hypothetical protein
VTSHIQLTVSFICQTVSDEELIPSECNVLEQIELAFPSMEAKYVVFPKLVEGATEQVIERHQSKVAAYFRQKADDERKAAERAQLTMWNSNGHDEA